MSHTYMYFHIVMSNYFKYMALIVTSFFFQAELRDLRQTTAILLQNMLDRLQVLERQVENVVAQSAIDISLISQQLKSLNNTIRKFNVSCGMYARMIHLISPRFTFNKF